MEKTALVLGATGLVGSELVSQLLKSNQYAKVVVFVRRPLEYNHPKLKEELIDFDSPETWQHLVKGDVLFSAFGTTLKKAKTKENQFKIDYTYQFEFAKAAAQNKVMHYILVSSAGANAESKNFYLQMKGSLDGAVKRLDFLRIVILRPSILAGNRKEFRLGEKIGLFMAKILIILPLLSKYRPISYRVVAKAMIQADNLPETKPVYELAEIFKLAKS